MLRSQHMLAIITFHAKDTGAYTRHCSYSLDDQGLAEVLLCVHKQELLSGQVLHNQLHLT